MRVLKTLANTRVDRLTFWIIFAVVVLANIVVRVVVDSAGLSPARWVVPLALTWGIWSLVCALRARDMGRSGWLGLLAFVPIVGLAVAVWLGFSRRWEDAQAAEEAANAAVLAVFGSGWMSLADISDALGDDLALTLPREKTAMRVRALDASGVLESNGLEGRDRRYRLA